MKRIIIVSKIRKKQKVSYVLFNRFENIQERSRSNGQVVRMCVHVKWNIVMNKTRVGGTIINLKGSALCRVNFMTTGWVHTVVVFNRFCFCYYCSRLGGGRRPL